MSDGANGRLERWGKRATEGLGDWVTERWGDLSDGVTERRIKVKVKKALVSRRDQRVTANLFFIRMCEYHLPIQ